MEDIEHSSKCHEGFFASAKVTMTSVKVDNKSSINEQIISNACKGEVVPMDVNYHDVKEVISSANLFFILSLRLQCCTFNGIEIIDLIS